MKNNVSINTSPAAVSKLLHRYHVVLFTVLILGGVAAMMFMVSRTITTSTDTSALEQQSQIAAPFDKTTIDQLEQLENTGRSDELRFAPNQRRSPFDE